MANRSWPYVSTIAGPIVSTDEEPVNRVTVKSVNDKLIGRITNLENLGSPLQQKLDRPYTRSGVGGPDNMTPAWIEEGPYLNVRLTNWQP
jgi:hypothetical protein